MKHRTATETKQSRLKSGSSAAFLSFRDLLQNELLARCRRNPSYSLNAFAKHLEVDCSALSKMLRGKRPIGRIQIQNLGQRLGLSAAEIEKLQKGLRLRSHDFLSYQDCTLDHFEAVSDWQHDAILELIKVNSFRPDVSWVARAIGISKKEAQDAVNRLTRLELLEVTSDGRWIDRTGGADTTVNSPFTHTALKKLQRQLLEKAIDALEKKAFERRSQTSMTMSIDVDRLPAALELTKKYRREMAALLSQSDKKTEVYTLSVSLFPLSEISEMNATEKLEK